MKNQRGDAGVGMILGMVIIMIGFWLFSSHGSEHGGHAPMMMGHSATHGGDASPAAQPGDAGHDAKKEPATMEGMDHSDVQERTSAAEGRVPGAGPK